MFTKESLNEFYVKYYFKRRSVGSGFVIMDNGDSYYLPINFGVSMKGSNSVSPSMTFIIPYLDLNIATAFRTEVSFETAYHIVIRKVIGELKITPQWRTKSKYLGKVNYDIDPSLLKRYDSPKALFEMVRTQTEINDLFNEETLEEIESIIDRG